MSQCFRRVDLSKKNLRFQVTNSGIVTLGLSVIDIESTILHPEFYNVKIFLGKGINLIHREKILKYMRTLSNYFTWSPTGLIGTSLDDILHEQGIGSSIFQRAHK